MKVSALLAGLAVLLFLSFGCSNDGPYSDCEEYYFSENFKQYVEFDTGSYWIYRDSFSGILDSLCLKESVITFNNRCDYNSIPSENLIQMYYSSERDDDFKLGANAYFGEYGEQYFHGVFWDESRPISNYIMENESDYFLNGTSYSEVSILKEKKNGRN